MSFKFFVGQAVEYTPLARNSRTLYKITRRCREEQAFDLKFRIKSEIEAYERNVPKMPA